MATTGKRVISAVCTMLMATPCFCGGTESRTSARKGLPERSVPTP